MNATNTQPGSDPLATARAAKLRYVSDEQPGFTRKRRGRHFAYYDTSGALLRDPEHLARIRSLVIPPAWTSVWICAQPSGHLQATGRDQRGRKQYRYHPRWCEQRNESKFGRMVAFGQALPRIRARVQQDLRSPGLSREKVLATLVRLLESTLIRIGNEEYVKTNESYGLTTLRNEHVEIEGTTVHFHFQGKSGIEHNIDLRDRRLARIVASCQELPGQELFQYIDDSGAVHRVDSADVNAYLHEITQEEFTAKDFRTWAGTLGAVFALQTLGAVEGVTAIKKNVVQAVKLVAKRLGNTPTVCRKYYVHPALIEAYSAGQLLTRFPTECAISLLQDTPAEGAPRVAVSVETSSLLAEEKALLDFLTAGSSA
ncbi:MAG TPA: DNA topoisomerase IB [Pseudomonadota bacterium]|nr:DNA topoisomerase IB [Pseudomonadota bacterium]